MSNFSVPETPDINTEELIFKLRRKMGTWLEWGEACQQLQKARISPQDIFEQTGFEPIQQNQIIVAAQVFRSVEAGDASALVIEHFTTRGSDVLYELRILSQHERASAAELAFNHGIDLEEAREVAKAMKDYGRLKALPDGYERSPGDAVAHQSWRLARQKEDLQARSRLIARGLKYASSDAARQALEKLLTDFTVVKSRPAPRLPIFRLDSEEEMPVIMPVVGQMPLTKADLQAVPLSESEGVFGVVKFAGAGAWVTLPGWQVLRKAEDAVALLSNGQDLAEYADSSGASLTGELLVVCDRDNREWRDDGYFLAEIDGSLKVMWWDTQPEEQILGRVLVVLRPKVVLDEDLSKDPWQLDE